MNLQKTHNTLKLSIIIFVISNLINLQSGKAQWELGVLHSFNGADGATAKGSLTLVDSTLYGRTSAGGANGEGVIFKVNTDGSGFQVLYSFLTGSNNGLGKEPHHDAMLLVDTILFGTAGSRFSLKNE